MRAAEPVALGATTYTSSCCLCVGPYGSDSRARGHEIATKRRAGAQTLEIGEKARLKKAPA